MNRYAATGPTAPRYAYTYIQDQIGRPGSAGPAVWHKGLAGLGQAGDEGADIECPWWDPFCPEGGTPTLPGELPGTGGGGNTTLPGWVSESDCKAREQDAYTAGQQQARSDLILTTVITGVVSAIVGAGVSYVLKS